MSKTSRRGFMKTTSAMSAGYFVAAGTQQAFSNSAIEKLNVACIGVGGKGAVIRATQRSSAMLLRFAMSIEELWKAKPSRKVFKRQKSSPTIESYLLSMARTSILSRSAPLTTCTRRSHLEAMRLGISCYTQKPLTRTIYEARLLAQVAKDTGVCTQMGNQGTAWILPEKPSPSCSPESSVPSRKFMLGRTDLFGRKALAVATTWKNSPRKR